MYAMVDSVSYVYNNVNQAYMAALMAAPMVVIELLVMRAMYEDTRLNAILVAASIVVGGGSFFCIRQQVGVADRQFLRSMIPHHAGAILMCGQASLSDGEIQKLCGSIVESQRREIAQMTAILERLR